MTAKKRIKVPKNIAAMVSFEADRACCICRRPGGPTQIHHLDGDAANNAIDNLVLLCPNHHSEVSTKSTMSRSLSRGALNEYRDDWLKIVEGGRSSALTGRTLDGDLHEDVMEALACHDIRTRALEFAERDWQHIDEVLSEIYPFVSSWRYGDRVRREVLDVAYDAAIQTHCGMPLATADRVREVAFAALPLVSLRLKASVPPNDVQLSLFQTAIEIGSTIAFDGVVKLEVLSVVGAGVGLLWAVLRYAHLNDCQQLKGDCIAEFEVLREAAVKMGNSDAVAWIGFQQADALTLDDDPIAEYPAGVAAKIHAEA